MKRSGALLASMVMLAQGAQAQNSLEILQRDLDEMRQEHDDVSSKNLEYFFNLLQAGEDSPTAADRIYLAGGGRNPDPARVITFYEHETPSEASLRTALDQSTMAAFDGTLQLQCGMMRFAALFVTQPKLETLPDDWTAWLKEAAQIYPQIVVGISDSRPTPGADSRNHPAAPRVDVGAPIRNMAMRDSPIGAYLGFHGWGDKEQGNWRVADVPRLYHDQILQPLRQSPTPATLAAWDIYIAMMNADQPDQEKWTDVDYPALQFDKECDDFASEPKVEKIEALIALIKAHPDYPEIDSWFDRVHDLIQNYAKQKPGADAAAPGPAPASAPVTAPALPPIQPDNSPPPAVVTPTGAGAPAR